ncbi:MAG: hypothetical protein GY855_17970 [candidate division Zixibacteria bacterium]|nr:hypothetical protein [candidate division Zixibacteria bacterium]
MRSKTQLVPLVIIITVLLAMMATSCGNRWQVKGRRIIAYVNNQPISYAEYDSAAKDHKLVSTAPDKDAEGKKEVLDEHISNVLIQQQVDSVFNALSNDEGFQKKKDKYLEKPVLKLLFQHEISSKINISDEEAQRYYENNLKKYTTPEQLRARHILAKLDIAEEDKEDEKKLALAEAKAKKKADGIYKQLKNGEDFAVLAEKHSGDEASAKRGGDLGFFSRGRMVKPFEDAAFALEIGDISEPVKSEFGYHIIKAEDRREEEIKPMDDSRKGQIKQQEKSKRERERADTFVDSIKQEAEFKFNEKLIANDEDTTLKATDWVVIANGTDSIKHERYIDQKPKYMRFKNLEELTIDDKKEMLKTLLINELLVHIAREKGLFNDPTMIEQGEQFTLTQANAKVDEFKEASNVEPTDSLMQAYFNKHISDFVVDKPLHVFHIIFTDSMMAEVIYDSIASGADFVEMAKRYYPGEPEIREVAFDLDFISEREMPKAFWDMANSLQVGTVSKPVKTEWGWHIIKLVSRKRSKTYDQVKSRIKSKLRDEANEKAEAEYVDRLRKHAKIVINEPLLDEYRITSQDNLKKHSVSKK